MKIIEITKEQLIQVLYDESLIVGEGSNGIVSKYTEESLVKIYYKEILECYLNEDFNDLDMIIEEKKKFEKSFEKIGLDQMAILSNLISHLEQTQSSYLEGIVTYLGYPIGVLITYFLGYEELDSVFLSMDLESKKNVSNRLKELFLDLHRHDIYPRDVKMSNVLIHRDSLDLKLIDLDDKETVCGKKGHVVEESTNSIHKLLNQLEDLSYSNQVK